MENSNLSFRILGPALLSAAVALVGCGGDSGPPMSSSSSSSSASSSSSSSSNSSSSSSSSSSSGEPVLGKKFVGNIPTNSVVQDDFIQFWDQISSDTEGRWTAVEQTRDVYHWESLDKIYDYAREHNIPVKAFGLVWGSGTLWMSNLSPEEQQAEIEEWIQEYCTRYPHVAMIEVVKDALPSHFPASFARRAFGENWITDVFTLARRHCPNAILIYDDYNFLTWDTEAILDLIEPAVKAGVVDAVGLQAHYLYDPKVWTPEEIRAKLDLIYARLGVPMYISEYELPAHDDDIQLRYMRMHFPVFYEHPHVAGITLWGYIYGQTWIEATGLIRDGQPRPALTWLMDYLGR